VGNTLALDPPRMHRQLEQWSRLYGDLYRLRIGNANVLVLGNHEHAAAVLRDRPDGFWRTRRLTEIGQEMGLTPGLFGSNGESWKSQRRMVMAAFDPAHVKAYFPALVKVTLRLKARWLKAAANRTPIDLQSDLMRFTVDAIAGLAFGAEVDTLSSNDDIIQNHLDKIFPALYTRIMSPIPTWRWFKRRADRDLDLAVAEVNKAIDQFIALARERLRADPTRRDAPSNLLEAMIVASDRPDSGVGDREVSGNVLTMLLAGEDTTANTIAWMIDALVRNQDALTTAIAEVRQTAPEVTRFNPEQMAELLFLEACAHETMRIKPVAPFIPLQAIRETTIGDVRVPRDTVVISLMRRNSIDDRYVDDAAGFKPRRWLSETRSQPTAGVLKRLSMPFGAGPRICPGRYLALLEIKMVMAMLLGNFQIEQVDTADGLPPVEQMAFTMAPIGLSMRLRALV
jgi:cytochrome P450